MTQIPDYKTIISPISKLTTYSWLTSVFTQGSALDQEHGILLATGLFVLKPVRDPLYPAETCPVMDWTE